MNMSFNIYGSVPVYMCPSEYAFYYVYILFHIYVPVHMCFDVCMFCEYVPQCACNSMYVCFDL